MKVIKITNALFVGQLAPLVQSFFDHVKRTSKVDGMSYETVYSHLVQTVQFGGESSELWVAFDDNDDPVGFAKFHLCGLPHYGKVYVEFLYSKLKDKIVSVELMKEFLKFGEKHNALLYAFDSVNPAVAKRLISIGNELGVECHETGITNFIGRKREVK